MMLLSRDIVLLFLAEAFFILNITMVTGADDDDSENSVSPRVNGLAPMEKAPRNTRVPGRYIIAFKPNLSKQKVRNDKSMISWDTKVKFSSADCLDIDNSEVCEVQASAKQIRKLRKNKDVDYVEEVQEFTVVQMCECPCPTSPVPGSSLSPTRPSPAPTCNEFTNTESWGLDRIDQKSLPLDSTMNIPGPGLSPVDVYVIDTGVFVNHDDFDGRAVWGTNTIDSDDTDGHGHGTHVAGTAAGKRYGIAKSAKIIAVKVLNARGSGSTTSVVKGMEWVIKNQKKTKRPSVANLSLGGGKSKTTNKAVKKLFKAGVTVVVAAGNSRRDSCQYSPASAKQAITVACSTSSDQLCSFSNYGKCVDVIAPGLSIKSAWIGSNVAQRTISGTSMSSPHTAGVAASYLSRNPSAKPQDVAAWVSSKAVPNVIQNVPKKTKNKLLHLACNV